MTAPDEARDPEAKGALASDRGKWLRAPLHAIGRGLQGAWRSPLIQLIAVGTIALSLVLVGAVELLAKNVGRIEKAFGGPSQSSVMTVYLEDGIAPERALKLEDALAHLPGVAGVRAVEPHEAWLRLRRSLGARADLLDGVEEGFLPASLEVALQPGVAEVIRVHPAFEKLRHAAGVEEVELEGDFTARLRACETLLHEAGLGVGLLVLGACLYIVGSTIRLGVFARKDELEIQKLVGATDGFVKGPFLVEGALQGALGAALAAGLLFGLFRLAQPRVEAALSGLLLGAGPLAFFRPTELALAIAAGALLGLLGSAVALGRYVKA